MTAATLNFLGKILCCPPIVNSPKGKPQATRTVIVAISPNNTAPNIENKKGSIGNLLLLPLGNILFDFLLRQTGIYRAEFIHCFSSSDKRSSTSILVCLHSFGYCFASLKAMLINSPEPTGRMPVNMVCGKIKCVPCS